MGKKTLILGVGNPILGDDGVGIAVARELAKSKIAAADVKEAETLGLDVLNAIEGYGRVIVVDAIVAPTKKTGGIIKIEKPERAMMTAHSASPHDVDFASAIETGKKLGMKIPEIVVYGINVEQERMEEFREGLSPEIEAAAKKAAKMILEALLVGNI